MYLGVHLEVASVLKRWGSRAQLLFLRVFVGFVLGGGPPNAH